MLHDAVEENDSLISETIGAIPNSRPISIKDIGKAILPISRMLLIF